MNDGFYRMWFAALAAMTPAVAGAALLAYLMGRGGSLSLTAALVTGIGCGLLVLFVGKSRGWGAVTLGCVVAVIGVALGFVFDAKWNGMELEWRRLAQEMAAANPGLTESVALGIVKTQYGNPSIAEILKSRADALGGWLFAYPVFAVAGAWLTIRSGTIARILRRVDS